MKIGGVALGVALTAGATICIDCGEGISIFAENGFGSKHGGDRAGDESYSIRTLAGRGLTW